VAFSPLSISKQYPYIQIQNNHTGLLEQWIENDLSAYLYFLKDSKSCQSLGLAFTFAVQAIQKMAVILVMAQMLTWPLPSGRAFSGSPTPNPIARGYD